MGDERPPHPGPRPAALAFPSGEARAAIDAAEHLADQVRDLAARFDGAMDVLNATRFEGIFATWFNGRGTVLHGELLDLEQQLRDDAEALRLHQWACEGDVADRSRAIRDHDRRLAAWRDWEAPDG